MPPKWGAKVLAASKESADSTGPIHPAPDTPLAAAPSSPNKGSSLNMKLLKNAKSYQSQPPTGDGMPFKASTSTDDAKGAMMLKNLMKPDKPKGGGFNFATAGEVLKP